LTIFLSGGKSNHIPSLRKNNAVIGIQGVIESCTDILTTRYWLHVELGKNIQKIK
jgi:hypothetical protein